jgi:hypothetical protein
MKSIEYDSHASMVAAQYPGSQGTFGDQENATTDLLVYIPMTE